MRRVILSKLRRLLKEVDIRLERTGARVTPVEQEGNGREAELESFLRLLPEQAYLSVHLRRLVRTLGLVPAAGRSALELGCYGHGAAAMERVLGYERVRGAYYAATPGVVEQKRLGLTGQAEFTVEVDLFDVERHRFPYEDGGFEVVLCGELIEHLLADPMHMLFECHRVLAEGGRLVLTTPNAASWQSVACALHGWRNPQIYSVYPAPGEGGVPHVREYTAREVRDAVEAAGFEVEALFTERLAEGDEGAWVRELLEREGFDTSLRGEQTYCVARRRSGRARERYPKWLYAT